MMRFILPAITFLALINIAYAQSRVNEARILANNGRLSEASSILEAELAKNPADTKARVAYGLVLSGMKRYQDARTELRRVLRSSNDPEALVALASVETSDGRLCEAERLTRGWKQRTPLHLELMNTRMKILQQLRSDTGAVEMANAILSVDPLNSEAAAVLKELRAPNRETAPHRKCSESLLRRFWTRLRARS